MAGKPLVATIAKRVLDITVSVLALVVTFPVMIIAAAAIRLESPGPALFRQERTGRDGQTFFIYKFRTMFRDIDRAQPVSDIDDPRVTRVGRFLRRNSIDELPQLINILGGSMSLVGPRPLLPGTTRNEERRRLDVRPGVTSLVQVSEPHLLDWDRRMQMDIWYVDNWSLRLDIAILFRTLPALFGRADAVDPPRI